MYGGQSQVGTDTSFVQAHVSQVIQVNTCLGGAFGFACKRHLLRHEIGKVGQVGIDVQRKVEEHITRQVG